MKKQSIPNLKLRQTWRSEGCDEGFPHGRGELIPGATTEMKVYTLKIDEFLQCSPEKVGVEKG